MKRRLSVFVLVFAILLLSVSVVSASVLNYRAHLAGRHEVPAVNTRAQGQAVFQMREDGAGLAYKLIVANIENVHMAHIHIAPPGVNGPVIVWLYPSAPPAVLIPGRTDGILAEGVLFDSDVRIDYNQDGVMNLQDLLDAINAGNTYVNVHTSSNPAGEVRGPIH
jgi:hypothetical protein